VSWAEQADDDDDDMPRNVKLVRFTEPRALARTTSEDELDFLRPVRARAVALRGFVRLTLWL
jgi:hypothetical protein